MGSCISTKYRNNNHRWPPRAMLILMDGSIREFYEPVKVQQILEDNPNHFVCSADGLYVGQHISQLLPQQEIHLGQLCFLLPLRKLQFAVSDSDMASLLLKANSAIKNVVSSCNKSSSKVQPLLFDIQLAHSKDKSMRSELFNEELCHRDHNSSDCRKRPSRGVGSSVKKQWKSSLEAIAEAV